MTDDWLINHIALLLTEDGKLAELLATLISFQCIAFVFILLTIIRLSSKADKEVK